MEIWVYVLHYHVEKSQYFVKSSTLNPFFCDAEFNYTVGSGWSLVLIHTVDIIPIMIR